MSESESESELSYLELDEEDELFVKRSSVMYYVKVVTIALWVNFRCIAGSVERRLSQEIQKMPVACVRPQMNLSSLEEMLRMDRLSFKKARRLI